LKTMKIFHRNEDIVLVIHQTVERIASIPHSAG